jgi:hypothetical protein
MAGQRAEVCHYGNAGVPCPRHGVGMKSPQEYCHSEYGPEVRKHDARKKEALETGLLAYTATRFGS